MNISEIFIRRPVLSMVLGAFMLLLGAQAYFNLPVRQYPEVEETVVTITTAYPGASPELIQGFITSPLAAAVSPETAPNASSTKPASRGENTASPSATARTAALTSATDEPFVM